MDNSTNQFLLEELLSGDASQAWTWLNDVWSGQKVAPDDFNWLGLAEVSTAKAHEESRRQSAVAAQLWARVATAIYDRLAQNADPNETESSLLSAMMLRATMIRRFGSVTGDPVLDQDMIVRWFKEQLPMSFDEAAQKAENWRESDIQEIKALRQIKNRLAVLEVLFSSGQISPDATLAVWLTLREKLP